MQGVNAILTRTLYYAQKNGYGTVSGSIIGHSMTLDTQLSLQDIFLFSSYFWERLRRNFGYACQAVAQVNNLHKNNTCT